jgi:hypothetical protein
MSITEREYRQAYDEGRRLCRVGRPFTECQKHDHTTRGLLLNEAREDGWNDEKRELRALTEARR